MRSPVRPPYLAGLLLRAVIPAGIRRETVLGDFHEDYVRKHAASPSAARFWYWREALGVALRVLQARARRRLGSDREPHDRLFHGNSPSDRAPRWLRVVERIRVLLADDILYALRNLRLAPGFAAVAVFSLALGIAPLATVGGFVNAMFLRPPLHVSEPDRLVAVFHNVGEPTSWPDLADAAAQAESVEDLAALNTTDDFNFTDGELTRSLMGVEVTSNFFGVVGVPLVLGRAFAADEMGRGAEPVVVISFTLWRQRFAAGEDALGQTLRINGRDHTIIGVAPRDLVSLEIPVEPDVYVPLGADAVENRGHRGIYGVGRLADGATLVELRAELDVVEERLRQQYPGYWRDEPDDRTSFGVYPLHALRLRPGQEGAIVAAVALVVLLGALVLVTACANLGNLLLARGWQRGGEIAVRLALGADRPALITMLLAESVLLGLAGGALAALGAHWLTSALRSGLIGPGVRLHLGVDWRVLVFTAVVSIATGVLFGMVPALRASSPELTAALKGSRRGGGKGRALSFRNVLVAGQVAASLALLVSAGVLLRSIQTLHRMDPGFDPLGSVTVRLDLDQRGYSDVEGRQFFDQLAARVASVPDVESVALSIDLPLDGRTRMSAIAPQGVELPDEGPLSATENRVSPGYFDLMRMPMLRGRSFSASDVATDVAVVNEAFEQRFWPEGALGKRFDVAGELVQVVGIVRNAKYRSLAENPAPIHFWRPFDAGYTAAANLVVRARSDARTVIPTLRTLVRDADPELPVLEPRLMIDVVDSSGEERRVASTMLAVIGVVSLTLAVVGIYGVVSFVVSRRTSEVGVRVALGARRADVVRMVLGQGMRLVMVGVVFGLGLAFGIAQVLAAAFPGVEALDPLAPAAAVLLLVACAAAATLVPALRASRVDPMVALRAE